MISKEGGELITGFFFSVFEQMGALVLMRVGMPMT